VFIHYTKNVATLLHFTSTSNVLINGQCMGLNISVVKLGCSSEHWVKWKWFRLEHTRKITRAKDEESAPTQFLFIATEKLVSCAQGRSGVLVSRQRRSLISTTRRRGKRQAPRKFIRICGTTWGATMGASFHYTALARRNNAFFTRLE
jgi:hypothetical protein